MNRNDMNLVLIGFMGSGKTSFGKWISQNLHMVFYDTDEVIESREGREIKDIFSENGELYFRELETQTIRNMSEKLKNSVVSVGGGLPVRPENREFLKKTGKVVYLRATEETLVKRLESDTKRPLLEGFDLKKRISDLMEQRSQIYESVADVIVDTDDRTFSQIYNEIEDKLFVDNNGKMIKDDK